MSFWAPLLALQGRFQTCSYQVAARDYWIAQLSIPDWRRTFYKVVA